MLDGVMRRLMSALGMAAPPTRHELHGLPVLVFNTRPDIATADVLTRLDAALGLIARHAPRRLARLRRDVDVLVVERFPCRGAFFPQQRAILTELTFLVNPAHSLGEIASSIVHEGVHARVAATCRDKPADAMGREERLCRRAELAFGLALPDGADVVARARALLALDDAELAPDIAWDAAFQRVRAADAGASSPPPGRAG